MSLKPLAIVLLSGSALVSGCASTITARTYQGAGMPRAIKRTGDAMISRLVSPDDPFRCLDPAAQRTAADVLMARGQAWRQDLDAEGMWLPGLEPPQMARRAPIADYPADMARDGESGAVSLLLLIETDGSVADVLVVCSTHDRLAKLAAAAARQNRYSPARVGDRTLRSLAMLPYAYTVD